jgi:DNA-binding CsgD family transcriptional regulator
VANLDAGLRLATKRELKLTFAPNCRDWPRSATKRGIVSAGASRRRGAGRARPNRATLTAQEAQPVELARQGLSNAEIADRLVISVRTVGTHLDRGMHKLGVRDRRDLGAARRGRHEVCPPLVAYRRLPQAPDRGINKHVSPWDDDDWVGTPPEGRYTRDRAKPEYWQRPWPLAGAGLVIVVIILVIVLIVR